MTDSNATDTRNILCDLPDFPDGVITFDLLSFLAANDNEAFPQLSYSLTLNATGQGTQSLPVSSNAWLWEIGLPDGNKPKATLSAGADIQLTAWLSAALSTETANSLEDFFLLLTGGTMTGAIVLASLTTAERDALTPAEGMIIYNETTTTVQTYQGAAWVSVGSGAGGGAVDSVFGRTGAVVAAADDYDITEISSTGLSEDDIILVNDAAGLKAVNPAVVADLLESSIDLLNISGIGAGSGDYFRRNLLDNSIEARTTAQVLGDIGAAAASDLTTHEGDATNPHLVTAAQAGALPTAGGTMAGTLAMADNLITRPKFTDYGETVNAIGSIGGGTQDINLTLGNVVSGTVDTSTTTFTFSNPPATGTAGSFTLFLTNGGSQTVNWPASVDWAGGTAPTLTAAGVDVLTFVTLDGGSVWFGFAAGLDMS